MALTIGFDIAQGRINLVTLQPFAELAEQGILSVNYGVGTARSVRQLWDMVEEHSTGYSGAFARQATLNPTSCRSQ